MHTLVFNVTLLERQCNLQRSLIYSVHEIEEILRQMGQDFRLNTTMIDIANKPVRPVTGLDVTIQL